MSNAVDATVVATRLSTNTVEALTSLRATGAAVTVLASDAIDGERDLFENRGAIARLTAAGIAVQAVPSAVATGVLAAAGSPRGAELILVGSRAAAGGNATALVRSSTGSVSISSDAAEISRLQTQVFEAAAAAARPVRGYTTSSLPRVPLTATPAVSTAIADCVFAVYDLETTGLAVRGDDRILSFSCQAVRIKPDGQIERLASVNYYVDPGVDALGRPYNIPADARRVNGLTHEQLAKLGARPLAEVLPDIVGFMRGLEKHGPVVLAGQNIGGFDHNFLNVTLSRTDISTGFAIDAPRPVLDAPFVDTRLVAQRVLADNPPMVTDERTGKLRPAWSLDAFISYFGLPPRGIHTADEDVRLTVEVLARLIQKADAKTIQELLATLPTGERKPFRGFRTRIDVDGGALRVTRDDFVGGIEDAAASGENPIVRQADSIPGGATSPRARDAIAVLKSCGYTCDPEALGRGEIVARL